MAVVVAICAIHNLNFSYARILSFSFFKSILIVLLYFIDNGCDPSGQNFGIFGLEGKWNNNFQNVDFENFGQPLEVVLFPEISELPEIFCSI